MKKGLFASLLALPAFLFVHSANAAPITGQANIAGNVSVSAGSIAFSPTFTNTAGAMETGVVRGSHGRYDSKLGWWCNDREYFCSRLH